MDLLCESRDQLDLIEQIHIIAYQPEAQMISLYKVLRITLSTLLLIQAPCSYDYAPT